jgi:hypothetical protein
MLQQIEENEEEFKHDLNERGSDIQSKSAQELSETIKKDSNSKNKKNHNSYDPFDSKMEQSL